MQKARTIAFNPVLEPKSAHGYKNVRWVENVSCGLRLVGFADEIAADEGRRRAIDHKGWFLTDDNWSGEVMRGVVYQLPARDGARYVYGYADPYNDDCALLCFDAEADKLDAARYADQFAERFAEQERDYQRAWQAGRDCERLADEVKELRQEALAIGAEMREARKAVTSAPTICATLRARVASLYREIQKARKERAELTDNFGTRDGFTE